MPTVQVVVRADKQASTITRSFTGEMKTRLKYDASAVSIETVLHGIRSFWSLLQRNETVSPWELASRIERHYDAGHPQVAAVCSCLRQCQ